MKRPFGALESPVDLRDYRISKSISKIDLPSEFRLPSTTIKDQGYVNSCVAHSLSSFLESKFNKVYSTGWIYGYRPEGYYQGAGMYPREAIKTIYNKGAVKQEDFPVNVEMIEAKELVDKKLDLLEAQAEDCQISSYARLFSDNEIKSWLFTKNSPVPFCIKTDDITLDENNIIQIPTNPGHYGHMMLLIGWNELGFIIQNSWRRKLAEIKVVLYYLMNILFQKLGGIESKHISKESQDIVKPSFFIIRKIIVALIKLLNNLVK